MAAFRLWLWLRRLPYGGGLGKAMRAQEQARCVSTDTAAAEKIAATAFHR